MLLQIQIFTILKYHSQSLDNYTTFPKNQKKKCFVRTCSTNLLNTPYLQQLDHTNAQSLDDQPTFSKNQKTG